MKRMLLLTLGLIVTAVSADFGQDILDLLAKLPRSEDMTGHQKYQHLGQTTMDMERM